ncbi:MAG: glycosyl hydrolase, partial [Vicinamibacterales bacterium]|nr:glycosyl hydrolase [Vicinamibacterales bacterium]
MPQPRRVTARTIGALLLTLAAVGALGARAMPVIAASEPGQALAALAHSFRTPPDDARIMMRWWWFGPTVTKAGLERELRLMKDGGIGGVEIQPVYPLTLDDAAAGLVTHPFLSDAFLGHVRHAATTARALGLRVDLTLGSGWPFGGPTVSIAEAAGKLRVERVAVPATRTLIPVPDIRAGERFIAAFLVPTAGPLTPGAATEVSDIRDGMLRLTAATEPRDVLFFINSHSGMMVKRPAVGAEGFVLNHYDRAALDNYLRRVGDRLLSAFDNVPPYAVFCDSLEVYDSDWTASFLDVFRAKRGYDLRPLLPALAVDAGPASAALRHDWAQTLTDLLDEQFMTPMQAWATQRGTKFRVQGYGVPPATISSNAGVDLPEGEGSQWKTLRASRWAASIGHLYDRPVISSETWTWLHSPVFMASPLDVKAEADLHFLQGINQLIGHGWPYTADGVAYPGWRFYAAGVFNEKNPWWIVMPDVSRYLQRVSFLMRQGQPANDVAVYLPVADTRAHFVPGKIGSLIETMDRRMGPDVIPAIIEAGYNLDFVDDGVLLGRGTVQDGRLAIGKNRYRAIILPGIERMPPDTMKAVESFARQGVHVIATRRVPALAPGYLATAAD